MDDQTRSDQITFLVRTEFADAIGPYAIAPEFALSGKFRDSAERAEKLRRKLESLSDEDLAARSDRRLNMESLLRKQNQVPEQDKLVFNQLRARANFDVWAKMAHWTIDEFVSLSLGRDPNVIGWDRIQKLTAVSPYAAEFKIRREICVRAKTVGQLGAHTSPIEFLTWADQLNFPVPPDLANAVKSLGHGQKDWKLAYERSEQEVAVMLERIAALEARASSTDTHQQGADNKTLSAKERTSLLKLVIGMAVAGYSYDPKAARSTTTKEITDDLRLNGINLDEDTVRKYLNEAKENLPPIGTD